MLFNSVIIRSSAVLVLRFCVKIPVCARDHVFRFLCVPYLISFLWPAFNMRLFPVMSVSCVRCVSKTAFNSSHHFFYFTYLTCGWLDGLGNLGQ